MMEQVQAVLDENPNLTDGIKTNIYELVSVFHQKFSNVKLDNLLNRLKNLQIIRGNKFVLQSVSSYDFRKNILYLNEEKLNEYDAKHLLMFELLNIMTATDTYTGFNYNGIFQILNVGYTEILANFLVGNEGKKTLFHSEASYTNLVSITIGTEILFESYFNNNYKMLADKLVEVGVVHG